MDWYYNTTGQLVVAFDEKAHAGMFEKEIDLSGQANGLYVVEAIAGRQRFVSKLLKR